MRQADASHGRLSKPFGSPGPDDIQYVARILLNFMRPDRISRRPEKDA
jgi:hypothetical protein